MVCQLSAEIVARGRNRGGWKNGIAAEGWDHPSDLVIDTGGVMSKHCRAKTKAGKLCKASPVERGLCAFHADPKRAAELGRIGGRKNRLHESRSEPEPVRPPQTPKEVKNLLAEAMAGIHAGRLQPKIASVMAYVGTALLKAFETTDLQERIEALERSNQRL
jgi:hypothetical protein